MPNLRDRTEPFWKIYLISGMGRVKILISRTGQKDIEKMGGYPQIWVALPPNKTLQSQISEVVTSQRSSHPNNHKNTKSQYLNV